MGIVAVGMSFKSAPLELLERSAIPPEHSPQALRALVAREQISEAVVLSTCNRVEVYAGVADAAAGIREIRAVFREECPAESIGLDERLYAYRDEEAIRHLFRVAAGLDSMIVGEAEILGQVRRAYQTAVGAGTAGAVLAPIFAAALRSAKRARTETTIAREGESFSSAAVELIRRELGRKTLAGTNAVVVGAGTMGRTSVAALVREGVEPSRVVVLSRSEERAREVAERWGARHRGLGQVEEELRVADAVVCCTAAPGIVIDRPMIRRVVAARGASRRLVIADIAVPRDVEDAVREEPTVVTRDIDDLHELVAGARGRRREQLERAEGIVGEEFDRLQQERRAAALGPTISALLEHAEAIRAREVERARGGLGSADDQAIDRLTKRIVASLLHAPIEVAKETAGSTGQDDDAAALKRLFRLS
jgi:glutamyl-tRNA reductase